MSRHPQNPVFAQLLNCHSSPRPQSRIETKRRGKDSVHDRELINDMVPIPLPITGDNDSEDDDLSDESSEIIRSAARVP